MTQAQQILRTTHPGTGRTDVQQTVLWALPLVLAVGVGLLVGRSEWMAATALVAAPALILFALSTPVRAALCVVAVTPWFVYPTTAGRFSLFLAVPVAGFAATLLILAQRDSLPERWRAAPVRVYASFVVVAAVMAVLSDDRATGGSRVVYLVLFGAFAWGLATAMLSGRMDRRALVWAVVIGGAIAAIPVIVQVIYGIAAGRAPTTDWLNSVYPLFGGERAAGVTTRNWFVDDVGIVRGVFPFMAAPSAGQYLMLCLVAAVWLRRDRKAVGGAAARAATIAVVLIALGLLATFSRQSWVGALIGILALSARHAKLRSLLGVGVALAILALVPIPSGTGTFGEYLLTAGDTSSTSSGTRLGLWQQGIKLIPAHALQGVGPGLYSTLNADPNHPIYYSHNTFLDTTVELGIVGALLLVAALAIALSSAWRRGAMLGFAMIVAFVVAGMFDDVLYFPRNGLLLAVAFGFAIAGDGSAARPRNRALLQGRHLT